MPANVESIFYVREAPWHGLGICVEEALDSKAALENSGLDWMVIQKPIMTADNEPIPGFKANICDIDSKVLGVVTDRYKVVSDFATHANPLRETTGYRENMFARTIEGNSLIDKAYEMVISA